MPKVGQLKIATEPKPFWQTSDDGKTARVYQGDVLKVLRTLPRKSVHCAVTSPPYWALRSYLDHDNPNKEAELGSEALHDCNGWARGTNCAENDWATGCHVCRMVLVMRELREVLRDDGTLWLNYGDTYASSSSGHRPSEGKIKGYGGNRDGAPKTSLPSGNLCGVPWRVALALQADGWILRSDIPWIKRSAMPESVESRPGKALEYVFMFTKSMNYFYDAVTVRKQGSVHRTGGAMNYRADSGERERNAQAEETSGSNFRNADLWFESISEPHGLTWHGDEMVGVDQTSGGYPGSHFAVYSPKLITPFIKASTSERGCCGKCAAPWERTTARGDERHWTERNRFSARQLENVAQGNRNDGVARCATPVVTTTGWHPTCECHGKFVKQLVTKTVKRRPDDEDAQDRDHSIPTNRNGKSSTTLDPDVEVDEVEEQREERVYVPAIPLEDHPVVPCTVFDPFLGSGTTVATAIDLGRRGVGIELNERYIVNNCIPRIEGVLLRRPATKHLTGKAPKVSSLGRPRG